MTDDGIVICVKNELEKAKPLIVFINRGIIIILLFGLTIIRISKTLFF